MPLTDTFAKNIRHTGAAAGDKHTDGGGMYLLVNAGGKYWRMNYRFDGKRKTLALGVPGPALADGVSNAEVSELANGVIKSYRADVVSLACLMQLTQSAFKKFTDADMSKLLELQKDCVTAFLDNRGIDADELSAASAASERAGRTAEYLDGLPA